MDCLSSGGRGRSLSGGVDIAAEKGLAEDGEQAALGLLTLLSAGVDELVDASRSCASCQGR